ncbi:MAG: DNA topoisomerase 3, partial [Opitutales bacterium]
MAEPNGNGSGKTLIIAEKPSVAGDLARVLGKVPKKDDRYENDELVISSAVGHLVELFKPEDVDPEYKKWRLDNLPIVPKRFGLRPIADNEKKFNELKKLIKRKDVSRVVNACDAGREGELIFEYITELAGCNKPKYRMWMSSMTPDAIRQAYQNLREDVQMKPLQAAARSRSEADWLIGMNGTRAVTLQYGSMANIAPVGRVQTPTLALVTDREREIREFVPRDYWRIEAHFGITSGNYTGFFQKPDWKKGEDAHDRADRLWTEDEANAIAEAVRTAPTANVTEEKKRSKQSSPRLFDLTTLQREANGKFGFPAGMTLNIAQSLYEKHKVLTYPRTDSRALPEDYPQTVRETLGKLPEPYALYARKILDEKWVQPGNKRIFNNAQVSDHFAIIPTGVPPKKLNEREEKIFDLVTRRFLSIFFPPAEHDVTTRLSIAAEHTFKTEGKVLVVPGWLEVVGRGQLGTDQLPPLGPEDGSPAEAKPGEVEVLGDQTRPPPRYSEATLLAAMEGAGKLVEDDELADAMKERGLGTPATRANIIDGLIRQRYMLREGRELYPSAKGEGLMEFLHKLGADYLRDPALTGDWEYKLKQVEEGRISREEFMNGIIEMTRHTIGKLASPPPVEETDLKAPQADGAGLLENPKAWVTEETVEVRGRKVPLVQVNKVVGNRRLELKEVQTLLDEGQVGPLDGFKSRQGKPFSAVLKLVQKDNGSYRVDFDFGDDDDASDEGERLADLSQYPVVGQSPVDGTPVRATPNAYVSEGTDDDGKPAFRMSRVMLKRTISEEEAKELLEKRKSPLLKGLVSKRTGRTFDAFLLLKDDGGIGFEFPPRKAAKKAAKKASKKAAKKASS